MSILFRYTPTFFVGVHFSYLLREIYFNEVYFIEHTDG